MINEEVSRDDAELIKTDNNKEATLVGLLFSFICSDWDKIRVKGIQALVLNSGTNILHSLRITTSM